MPDPTRPRPSALAFVYNADRGLFNTLSDLAHKVLSPSTYACNLCAITHSPLGMRDEWKQFLDGLGLPLEFYHRDQREELGLESTAELPLILARFGTETRVLVTASQINGADTSQDLRALIEAALPPIPGE